MSPPRSLRLTLGFALVAIASSLAAAVADDAPQGARYALLVAVKDYSEARQTPLRALQFTTRDINDLKQVLLSRGFREDDVTVLDQSPRKGGVVLDRWPLKDAIERELDVLLRLAGPEDIVVLALSGHGVQLALKDGRKKSFFCPADADIDRVETLVALDDIYGKLEQCRAKLKLLLVDACRKEPVDERTRALPRFKGGLTYTKGPDLGALPRGVVAMFSCSEGEFAHEDPELGHGIFFHYVIDGLKGKALNQDAEITVKGLADFVETKVRDHCLRTRRGEIQTPQTKTDNIKIFNDFPLVGTGAVQLLKRADECLEQGKVGQAIELAGKALGRDPRHARAYCLRGRCYSGIGRASDGDPADLERALSDLDEALRLDDKLWEAVYERGMVFLARRDYVKAVADFSAAVTASPRLGRAYFHRGVAYLGTGEDEKSVADFARAIALDPKVAVRARVNRGSALGRLHRYEEALREFREALLGKPDDEVKVQLYFNRGQVYKNAGQYAKALEDLRRVVAACPDVARAYLETGTIYALLKDNEKAVWNFEQALEIEPDYVEAFYQRGLVRAAQGGHDRALADFDEAIRYIKVEDVTTARLFETRGRSHLARGAHDEAIADCTRAIALAPALVAAYECRSRAYRAKGMIKPMADDEKKARELVAQGVPGPRR